MENEIYRQQSMKTASDLRTIAAAVNLRELSQLELPEIERLTDEVARVVPAGNVPGLVLSGLSRVGGRQVEKAEAQKHIGLLFRGARQALDKAVYNAFFAGPAAVLYGYQQILKLAGKDQNSAFPDGTWQFYLEFALREDNARHANETTGFHTQMTRYNIHLSEADTLAAWILEAATFLYQLPEILANEWYEPVVLKILADVSAEKNLNLRNLSGDWEAQRPYQRASDAGRDDYPTYRRRVFEKFLKPTLDSLTPDASKLYYDRLKAALRDRLPAYQRQMTWLAFLEPDAYNESRVPYTLEEAFIGVVWQGRYSLLPVKECLDPQAVRAAVDAIFKTPPQHPRATLDEALVTAQRSQHPTLRKMLDAASKQELEKLRRAPVIINWDQRDARLPLVDIRKANRGIGDHALTIFRTQESIVFDQSHIFFDGGWGSAVAEIMTNETLSWALYLSQVPAENVWPRTPYSPALQVTKAVLDKTREARVPSETGAENTTIKLNAMLNLRKMLKQRSDLMTVTVNDLLVLYRGLHSVRYTPSPELQRELDALAADRSPDARRIAGLIRDEFKRLSETNPSVLIPIDARQFDPRERLFPTTFRNPLTDFNEQHTHTLRTLRAYKSAASGTRGAEFKAFHEAQLTYLRLLAGFGELLSRYRRIALEGQSTSTASIRVLGHLPPVMQKLLDTIPGRFDVLNEVIKGEEVFSNMGKVAKGSTLRRFITAKDDNEQKTLAWGVITDTSDILHLSLRDFRPHVAVLQQLGKIDLAQKITQDYVDSFANGLNQYISELREITIASRETMMQS